MTEVLATSSVLMKEIKFIWKINDFSVMLSAKGGNSMDSPQFKIKDKYCCLRITDATESPMEQQEGWDPEKNILIRVAIVVDSGDSVIPMSGSLSIDMEGQKILGIIGEPPRKMVQASTTIFKNQEPLNIEIGNFKIPDDMFRINQDVSNTEIRVQFHFPSPISNTISTEPEKDTGVATLIADLRALLNRSAENADFSIECGGKTFRCHELILRARSTVMDDMFKNKIRSLVLGNVGPNTVLAADMNKMKTDYVICVYNENFVGTYQSLNGNGGKENNNDPVIDIVRNKNAKIKKPCKYFNEGSCEVKRSHLSKSRLTQWLHVCQFCFAKYGNEKLHPESQCEYKKNANDESSSGMSRSVDESKRNKKVGDEDENIMKEERRSWKREGSCENGDSKRRRSRSRERSSRSNYRSRSRERERSSERWNGREVKVDREAVEMDRSRDDHRKRSRYSQERERDRRGDVDRNREVDRSRKYEDGFKRTRQDLQVEDDHRISKRERDDREDLQARNSSLRHETASLSNQPRNAEASQLQYPEKTQEDEIQLLHRKVADCVKKRLNMYWAHIETTEPKNRKINDPEEYTKLAKHFSYRMRDQIKETYEQYERTLEGITLTADNREQIKTAIDMHFDSKPVIKLEGYRR